MISHRDAPHPLRVALITNGEKSYFKKHFYTYFNENSKLTLIDLCDSYDFNYNYQRVIKTVEQDNIDLCVFQMGDLALKLNHISQILCEKICFISDDDWMYSIRTKYVSSL